MVIRKIRKKATEIFAAITVVLNMLLIYGMALMILVFLVWVLVWLLISSISQCLECVIAKMKVKKRKL